MREHSDYFALCRVNSGDKVTHLRAIRPLLLAALLIVLTISCNACTQGDDQKNSNHLTVGLWELENDSRVFLAIYRDHKAALRGRPLTWDAADDSAVRLQEKTESDEQILHFRIISIGDKKSETGELREGGRGR
jgi:hypothetical protein